MDQFKKYFESNKYVWNQRTIHHKDSAFYDLNGFKAGKSVLSPIEIEEIGDVKGKSLLHLQCHFGMDSLDWARRGASVTGVDISDAAIKEAVQLNDELALNAKFVCCNVYDTSRFVEEQFDIVFSSYGTIGWLPDLKPWAKMISERLKKGGFFYLAEFHPVVWMFDNDFEEIKYSYFKDEAIIETETGTYTNPEAPVELTTITWNHSLSEVLGALLSQRLNITAFEEYDYSPYNCFKHTMEKEKGRYVIKHLGGKLPIVYALAAEKP